SQIYPLALHVARPILAWNINQAFPGSGSVNSRRPFPAFGNITGGYISSIGNSNFNGLTARAERRMTNGLSLITSYTWSKAIDDRSEEHTSELQFRLDI